MTAQTARAPIAVQRRVGRRCGRGRARAPARPPGRRPAGGRASCATNVTMDAEDLLLRQFLGILRPGRPRAGRPLDPLPAARRRHLGQLRRRPGRPVDDDRGLRRAAAGRRRRRRAAPARGPRVHPGQRRHRGQPGVHPHLAGAVRRVVLGRAAGDAAGADPAAVVGAAQRLRLGLLGPPDRRADHGRGHAAPGPAAAVHARRAAHRRARRPTPPTDGLASRVRPARQGAARPTTARRCTRAATLAMRRAAEWIVARQEADGGWGGIQPPWVYSILALHLLGYPLDHPVLVGRDQGPRGLPRPRGDADGPVRRLEACQSPVWDTCLAVIALLDAGRRRRRPGGAAGRRLAAGRGDPRSRATGRCAGPISRRPAGRSSSPTTATPTSTTPPRWCWRCAASTDASLPRPPARSSAASGWTVGMQSRRRRLGRVRRRQHPAHSSRSCRSATSAR